MVQKTAAQLAELLGGTVIGNETEPIQGVTNIEAPKQAYATFISDSKHLSTLEATDIAAIIVGPEISKSSKTLIQVPHPKMAWARALLCFNPVHEFPSKRSKSASISSEATIGKDCFIGDFVVIEAGAVIGDKVILEAGCYIGRGVRIGTGSHLHPHVCVYHDCLLGEDVIIHANSVIGSDGFGYVESNGERVKVPQVGNVTIGNRVEIGSCTTIDRATMQSTRIEDGVKIDNLVQIAHNVRVGANSAISGLTGVSGSAEIGKNCTIGGQVGLADHCYLEDNVMVGAQAGVPPHKKLRAGKIYLGSPAREIDKTKEQIAAAALLPKFLRKIQDLEDRVKELEQIK